MEQTPNTSLFSLMIDPITKAHLFETARWARFLAIVGMVFTGFGALMVIFFVSNFTSITGANNDFGGNNNIFPGFGVGVAIFYMLLLLIWFIPILYLLRFSNRMKTALNGSDQNALNNAFQNLRSCFRFFGIITIIVLAFWAIGIIFMILGAAIFS